MAYSYSPSRVNLGVNRFCTLLIALHFASIAVVYYVLVRKQARAERASKRTGRVIDMVYDDGPAGDRKRTEAEIIVPVAAITRTS
jgi:hypothetical protein